MLAVLPAAAATEIMPLSEVRPGMEGEWRTVVRGTTIETFQLRIVGVAANFVGPEEPVIIAEATEEVSVVSGPVAGMSGSPVFIDGRLIGAYAYGYTWPKEQTLIGITPIEQMLPILEYENLPERTAGANRISFDLPPEDPELRPLMEAAREGLRPLPTPLLAGGFSQAALDFFREDFEELGLEIMQAPTGRADAIGPAARDLQPGSAVSGVLMTGDFNMAGTGTVTWREGDQILAFGHPFFQFGPVELPMAAADIITVVRTLNRSFKLSNLGPVVGAITQDRLTAIAGEIGRQAPMSDLRIRVHVEDEPTRTYESRAFHHPRLTSLILPMALLQSLNQTLDREERQTFAVRARIDAVDLAPILFEDMASGPAGAGYVVRRLNQMLGSLLENPFPEAPLLENVEIDVFVANEWDASVLREVRVETPRVRPGEDLLLSLQLGHYQSDPTTRELRIPIPRSLEPGTIVEVLIAEAAVADRVDQPNQNGPVSFDELLDRLRSARSRDHLYVKLLEKTPGLRTEGQNLPSLPPSVRASFTAPATQTIQTPIVERTLWEDSFDVPGYFTGDYRVRIQLAK